MRWPYKFRTTFTDNERYFLAMANGCRSLHALAEDMHMSQKEADKKLSEVLAKLYQKRGEIMAIEVILQEEHIAHEPAT